MSWTLLLALYFWVSSVSVIAPQYMTALLSQLRALLKLTVAAEALAPNDALTATALMSTPVIIFLVLESCKPIMISDPTR